jgi:hypothetical protein
VHDRRTLKGYFISEERIYNSRPSYKFNCVRMNKNVHLKIPDLSVEINFSIHSLLQKVIIVLIKINTVLPTFQFPFA